jgi:hypothetical protein
VRTDSKVRTYSSALLSSLFSRCIMTRLFVAFALVAFSLLSLYVFVMCFLVALQRGDLAIAIFSACVVVVLPLVSGYALQETVRPRTA